MATWNNTTKQNTTWNTQTRGGQGWKYNQANINYDSTTDPLSLDQVLYDSIGLLPAWTTTQKHTTNYTNQTKH